MSARLDPVILLRDIRAMQERLATLADAPPSGSPAAPSIELVLRVGEQRRRYGAARPTDSLLSKQEESAGVQIHSSK